MASEITATLRLKFSKSFLSDDFFPGTQAITMSGNHSQNNVQTIGTGAGGTAIAIAAAIATLGCAMFRNLDSTNYCTIGIVVSATFYPLIKLKPGEAWCFRIMPGISLYAKADTASVDLLCGVLED
jgi:hypothetical protein